MAASCGAGCQHATAPILMEIFGSMVVSTVAGPPRPAVGVRPEASLIMSCWG
jgi:hypothetical protein